jgi:hypothetical protein
MFYHRRITAAELRNKIRNKEICLGGKSKLKIFGTLHCKSGKRQQKKPVYFSVVKKKRLSSNTGLADTA